ncbi:hypothetical protein ACHAW6_003373 [Cyclotella cf. meneghiniana]
MPSNGRKQYRHHQGKRKHDSLPWDGDVQEAAVDDLLIASMAVASTWRDELDKSSSSQSENESEGSTDKGSDSDDDGVSKHDPDEISIPSSDQNEAVATLKEDDDRKLIEKSDTNENSPNLRVQEEDETDDDDGSVVDLTEHLANMEDDEEDAPKNSKGNQSKESFGIYEGPKTEHEIDPYKCPTEELEKLNVCVGIEQNILGDLAVLDEATRNQLRIAGTIRTYLLEQRTIVVDSVIPAALQGDHQNHNSMDAPLDEGSMLAILLRKGEDGTHEITTLKKDNEYSLHVIGKILEVFGPVQRPLYVIRLPDSPKAEKSSVPFETEEKPRNEPSKLIFNEEVAAVGSLLKIEGSDSIENVNDDEGRGSKVKEEAEDKDSTTDGSLSDGINPERVSAVNVHIEGTCKEKASSDSIAQEDDPWSHNGKLSCILRKSPNAVVYSLLNHVKLIDKDLIIRVSGKGCDASNMFDEEIGPSEQQDFSDDEDEREARKGNRKSRQPVKNDGQVEKRRDGLNNFNGRSSVGKGGGRGRDRGHGRGMGHTHGNALHNLHHMQQQQQAQQPVYHATPPASMQYQYPNLGYTQTPHTHPTHTYQQFNQGGYPLQYYQQSFHTQPTYHGGYPGYGYGAPPPPPPPPPRENNMPVGHSRQEHTANAAPSSAQGDTVYYDYSGS